MKHQYTLSKATLQSGLYREIIRNRKVLSPAQIGLLTSRIEQMIHDLQGSFSHFLANGVYQCHVANLITFYTHQSSVLNRL